MSGRNQTNDAETRLREGVVPVYLIQAACIAGESA